MSDLESGFKYVGKQSDYEVILLPSELDHLGKEPRTTWFVRLSYGGMTQMLPRRMSYRNIRIQLRNYGIDADSIDWQQEVHGIVQSQYYELRGIENAIYALVAIGSGRVKIGWAKVLESRVKSLSASCPFPLGVLGHTHGDRKREKSIHRKFSHLNLHNEWFQDCADIREYISNW